MSNLLSKIKTYIGVESKTPHKFWIGGSKNLLLLNLTIAAISAGVSAGVFTLMSKTKIAEKSYRSYIINNPDDIIASLRKKEEQQKSEAEQEGKKKAMELHQKMLDSDPISYIGNRKSKNLVIELYDYSCSYCKAISEELRTLLERNDDVKLVLLDFPILSPISLYAAKASLMVADKHPTKLKEFHFKLISNKNIDENTILTTASSLGINKKELQEAITSPKYESYIKSTYSIANDLKVGGTPVLIINGKLLTGYVSYAQISEELKTKKSDIENSAK